MTADKKDIFLYYWKLFGVDYTVTPEYQFASPRKWRFDWAFITQRVAIEVEGGVFVYGAHNRGFHFTSDCEKYNTASAMNWLVFRFTPDMLQDDPQKCILQVLEGLFAHANTLHRLEVINAPT